MDTSTIISILGILIVPAFAYLLNKKDEAQEEKINAHGDSIKLLFKKHDDDAAALVLLQRQIDKEHYVKPELDARFQSLDSRLQSLEATFRAGLHELSVELGGKFDNLSEALVAHISREPKK